MVRGWGLCFVPCSQSNNDQHRQVIDSIVGRASRILEGSRKEKKEEEEEKKGRAEKNET